MKSSWLVPIAVIASAGFAGWMVREEGKATREAMRANVEAGVDRAGDRIDSAIDRKQDVIGRAVSLPGDILGEVMAADGRSEDREADRSNPADGDSEAGGAADLIDGMIAGGYEVLRKADEVGREVFRLPEAQRDRIGREIREKVLLEFEEFEGPALSDRLARLVEPLLSSGEGAPDRVSVMVLDSDELNAFSHVGGHLYLHRGLIELAEEDVELQFVLAHELAHIALGHCDAAHSYAHQGRSIGGELAGVLVEAAHRLVSLGYSERQEFDCDDWAYRTLRRIGHSHEGSLSFMYRFRAALADRGLDAPAHPGPEAMPEAGAIDRLVVAMIDHFSSHPPISRRIDRLERFRDDAAIGGG